MYKADNPPRSYILLWIFAYLSSLFLALSLDKRKKGRDIKKKKKEKKERSEITSAFNLATPTKYRSRNASFFAKITTLPLSIFFFTIPSFRDGIVIFDRHGSDCDSITRMYRERRTNKQCRFHCSLVNPGSNELDLSRTLRKHYRRVSAEKKLTASRRCSKPRIFFIAGEQRYGGSNCAPVFS